MSRGGKRPGSGRKKGSANRKTREIADRAIEEGTSPLEYMLSVMRDEGAESGRRDDMAKAAAPYVHPRLAAVEHTGKDGDSINHVHRIERVVVDPANTNA
jgi:hypothetical protein